METNDLIWAANSFGEIIRRAREVMDLTQKQLADRCKQSTPVGISQIERDERIPDVRLCSVLAKALKLDGRRLLATAYIAKAPAQIRDGLAWRDSTRRPETMSARLSTLLEAAARLPQADQDEVVQLLESALRLAA
jgi:transcriptional regulator with XRE-family HTH domain